MEEKFKILITRYLSGNLSPEEEKEFQLYLKADPKNQEYFKEIEKIWNQSVQSKEKEYTPDTPKEWNKVRSILTEKSSDKKLINFRSGNLLYKAAAIIIITLALGYFAQTIITSAKSRKRSIISYDFEKNTDNNPDVFYLSDGTLVFMNINSSLYFKESDGKRIVYLKGEAYFDVKKDSLRPFIIEAGDTFTQVLGTSFGIKAYEDQSTVDLLVTHGKVNFSKGEMAVDLTKDQKGTFNKKSEKITSEKNKDPDFLKWKEDKKKFKNSSLYKQEKSASLSYLHNESSWRRNKIRQTIIEGEIHNTAIFTGFKNIKVKVLYYKDGNKLGESKFTISKSLKPGEFHKYKHALPDWFENTKDVKLEIESAQFIEE